MALAALADVLQIKNMLASMVGVFFGLFIGATPGLTISLGMVLLLPLTFALSPVTAFCLLLGLYSSGFVGGSISAILLNIPGTPSAAATAIDGHAMAINGRGGEAIGTAVTASFFGGMFSLFCLVLIAPSIAKIALRFGAPELFALVLLGLTLICSFGQKYIVKGLIAGVFGLIIMTIGLDPLDGTPRFTFGSVELQAGISFLPALIGLFAIPQIINGIISGVKVIPSYHGKVAGVLPKIKNLRKLVKSMSLGALIGTGIGSVPGAGGPIAVFLSYDYAARLSKNQSEFGKGTPEGVAAPESANNGVAGGALIPMLTLGIPGDPITAILLGALMIQGLTPGPLLFENNGQFVYSIFWAFLVANILTLILTFATIKLWVRIHQVPSRILLPIITILCIIGSYSLRNTFFDTGVMLLFGVIGYLMNKFRFPVVPLLLAIILGPALEEHLRMSLIISQGDYSIFFTQPISLIFLLLAFFSFTFPVVAPMLSRKKAHKS
ncbi:MAG: tripartite tricarboxylate transporter permease [Eudoraea sp.]|nr:tripartite tricarboxylate transporter permease [Eudoraea sp.]NNK31405.1 C4-dicarboxylate ABC transporter permease [Flavobacteriaceae bacterium]